MHSNRRVVGRCGQGFPIRGYSSISDPSLLLRTQRTALSGWFNIGLRSRAGRNICSWYVIPHLYLFGWMAWCNAAAVDFVGSQSKKQKWVFQKFLSCYVIPHNNGIVFSLSFHFLLIVDDWHCVANDQQLDSCLHLERIEMFVSPVSDICIRLIWTNKWFTSGSPFLCFRFGVCPC